MDVRYNLNRLTYYVATIDAGTITGAALRLGVSKAVVSKQLQILETEIGTPLLSRNTRQMTLTDAGAEFYQEAKSALTLAHEAYERVLERDREPKGSLRITAPVDFGISHVAPFIARFQERFPKVAIDLVLSDTRIDLVRERFDLGFRIGWLEDSSNRARKLRDFEEVLVCSPKTRDLLNLKCPTDLSCATYVANSVLQNTTEWTFTKGQDVEKVTLSPRAHLNATLAIRAYLKESCAFSMLPNFTIENEFADGSLVRLLPEWSLRTGGVFTVTPPTKVRSNALKRLLELVHSQMNDTP